MIKSIAGVRAHSVAGAKPVASEDSKDPEVKKFIDGLKTIYRFNLLERSDGIGPKNTADLFAALPPLPKQLWKEPAMVNRASVILEYFANRWRKETAVQLSPQEVKSLEAQNGGKKLTRTTLNYGEQYLRFEMDRGVNTDQPTRTKNAAQKLLKLFPDSPLAGRANEILATAEKPQAWAPRSAQGWL